MKTLAKIDAVDTTTEASKIKILQKSYDFDELYAYLENNKSSSDVVLLSIVHPMYNEERTIKNVSKINNPSFHSYSGIHYSRYYRNKPHLIDVVRKKYKDDIELFGYEYENRLD